MLTFILLPLPTRLPACLPQVTILGLALKATNLSGLLNSTTPSTIFAPDDTVRLGVGRRAWGVEEAGGEEEGGRRGDVCVGGEGGGGGTPHP